MANCCTALQSIPKTCGASMGGIKKVYVNCYGSISRNFSTHVPNINSNAGCWYTIDFYKETSSMETTANFVEGQYLTNYTTTINLVLKKLSNLNMTGVSNLLTSELSVIVEDNNGAFWCYGIDYPVIGSEATGTTGVNFSDQNGHTITLTAQEFTYTLAADNVTTGQIIDIC